jgi:DNA-binding NarL/FixJ family response regulator
MEDSIRVLIADDHPLFRDGMRGLLGSLPDMEVVGEASSGEQAMELARELQPDVTLWTSRCQASTV